MKKLWLLVLVATIVSCEPEKKADYAIISGKIEKAKSNKLTIYSAFDRASKIEITLNEDGSFNDTLKMASDFYVIRQDRNLTEVFAPKGSNLKLDYDAKKKDSTMQITGSVSSVNTYIFDKEKVSKSTRGDQKEMFLKNENDFQIHIYTSLYT